MTVAPVRTLPPVAIRARLWARILARVWARVWGRVWGRVWIGVGASFVALAAATASPAAPVAADRPSARAATPERTKSAARHQPARFMSPPEWAKTRIVAEPSTRTRARAPQGQPAATETAARAKDAGSEVQDAFPQDASPQDASPQDAATRTATAQERSAQDESADLDPARRAAQPLDADTDARGDVARDLWRRSARGPRAAASRGLWRASATIAPPLAPAAATPTTRLDLFRRPARLPANAAALAPAPARVPTRVRASASTAAPRAEAAAFGPCEAQVAAAARRHGVPEAVLYGVGLTETGRRGRLSPYALNIDGRTVFPADLAGALAAFRQAKAQGAKFIDVGCMQINHRFHGHAFGSVEAMFDPARNVDYSARFLKRLHASQRSWTLAAARYNAGPDNDPAQRRYVCAVMGQLVASGAGRWTESARAFCGRK